jgi:FlaA1/EpsC-like NDP-sugar epimerase
MMAAVQTTNTGKGKTTVIAGATGYIGKSVVRESVRQGYNTIALVRDVAKVSSAEGKALYGDFFEGATVVECDVCDANKLTEVSYQNCHCVHPNPPFITIMCACPHRACFSRIHLSLSLQIMLPCWC